MPGSPVVDIRNSFGAAFIGLLVSTMLFGMTIVQTWIYFWNYRNRDPKSLKFFIAYISVMDTLHTILSSYAIYWYLVLNFGNPENLGSSMWALDAQVIIAIFLSASVQLYYAKRVYRVSKSMIYLIVIVALVVVVFSFNLLFSTKGIMLKRFTSFHSLTWIMCAVVSTGALLDMLIAAAMCWSLYLRRTGFARTDSIITTLMAYSVNTGLLTSLLAAAMMISFVASSKLSLIWLAIYWVMSKGYVNSLLAMLNSRDHVRNRSASSNPDNTLDLFSIRIEQSRDAYGTKYERTGVSDSEHHDSTTLDFARNTSDHDTEPTSKAPKPDANIAPFQSQG